MLAAGRGRRFADAGGQEFKQAIPFRGHGSMVEYVCSLYAGCGLPVACALHPALAPLGVRLAEAGYRVVPVAEADGGMGNSLAAAVAATPSEAGWLVALADMPMVRPATIRAVADGLCEGAALCAPWHRGRRGHPVGFGAAFGPALRALHGDAGARAILLANRDRIRRIETDDPGIFVDVDEPAVLAGLES